MSEVTTVFRGTVLRRETLPQRVEMKGRGRHAITFAVDEYWKGSPGGTATLYGFDGGTDCFGDYGYEVGKSYLVYAELIDAKDVSLGDPFWNGWSDVFPEGTKILIPQTACMPGGETSKARKALRQLGKGRVPARKD